MPFVASPIYGRSQAKPLTSKGRPRGGVFLAILLSTKELMHNRAFISGLVTSRNLVCRQGAGSGVAGIIGLRDGAAPILWDKQ